MIKRLYIHNFRCLENFELPIAGIHSTLLIGKNGTGKSTIGRALEVLQDVARGTNRVRDVIKPGDFSRGRSDTPMRFELDVDLAGVLYTYVLAFEQPPGFKELRVHSEGLSVDAKSIYSREVAQVALKKAQKSEVKFLIDWHLIALPLIQDESDQDPLFIFKRWLAQMMILAPIPSHIAGDSAGETLEPNREVNNLGEWFTGILGLAPANYQTMASYLQDVFPDFVDIKNPLIGSDTRSLHVQFRSGKASLSLPFSALSDGEKCFFICALVLAANQAYGPIFCFWDEPDNYLSLSEVGHFIMALRRAFEAGGQILMTSHNPEAIRHFSDENTLLLYRRNHLEPTQVRRISQIQKSGDLIDALIRGELEP